MRPPISSCIRFSTLGLYRHLKAAVLFHEVMQVNIN